jgi:hypothetical protein
MIVCRRYYAVKHKMRIVNIIVLHLNITKRFVLFLLYRDAIFWN